MAEVATSEVANRLDIIQSVAEVNRELIDALLARVNSMGDRLDNGTALLLRHFLHVKGEKVLGARAFAKLNKDIDSWRKAA